MSDAVQKDELENAPDSKAQTSPLLIEEIQSNQDEARKISQDVPEKDQKEGHGSQEKMDIDQESNIVEPEKGKAVVLDEKEKNVVPTEDKKVLDNEKEENAKLGEDKGIIEDEEEKNVEPENEKEKNAEPEENKGLMEEEKVKNAKAEENKDLMEEEKEKNAEPEENEDLMEEEKEKDAESEEKEKNAEPEENKGLMEEEKERNAEPKEDKDFMEEENEKNAKPEEDKDLMEDEREKSIEPVEVKDLMEDEKDENPEPKEDKDVIEHEKEKNPEPEEDKSVIEDEKQRNAEPEGDRNVMEIEEEKSVEFEDGDVIAHEVEESTELQEDKDPKGEKEKYLEPQEAKNLVGEEGKCLEPEEGKNVIEGKKEKNAEPEANKELTEDEEGKNLEPVENKDVDESEKNVEPEKNKDVITSSIEDEKGKSVELEERDAATDIEQEENIVELEEEKDMEPKDVDDRMEESIIEKVKDVIESKKGNDTVEVDSIEKDKVIIKSQNEKDTIEVDNVEKEKDVIESKKGNDIMEVDSVEKEEDIVESKKGKDTMEVDIIEKHVTESKKGDDAMEVDSVEKENNVEHSKGNDAMDIDSIEREKDVIESKEENDTFEEENTIESEKEKNVAEPDKAKEESSKPTSPISAESKQDDSNTETDKIEDQTDISHEDIDMEEAQIKPLEDESKKPEAEDNEDHTKKEAENEMDSDIKKSDKNIDESADGKDADTNVVDAPENLNKESGATDKKDTPMECTQSDDIPCETQELVDKSNKEDDIRIDDYDKEKNEKRQGEGDDKIVDDKEKVTESSYKESDTTDGKKKEDDHIVIVDIDEGSSDIPPGKDKEQDRVIVDSDKEPNTVKKSKDKNEEVADTDWGRLITDDVETVAAKDRKKAQEPAEDSTSIDKTGNKDSNDKEIVIEIMDITDDNKNKENEEMDSSDKSIETPITAADTSTCADSDDTTKDLSQTTVETMETSDPIESSTSSEKDILSQNSTITDENAVFVQVSTEKDDQNDPDKSSSIELVSNEVDPIGSAEWNQNTDPVENTFISDLDEADECIIPDASKEDTPTPPSSQESGSLSSTPSATTSTASDSMKLSEKYLVSVAGSTQEQLPCMICNKRKTYKYNCVKDNYKTALCSEECLTKLKQKHTDNVIVRKLRVKNFSTDLRGITESDTITISSSLNVIGNIRCKNCGSLIANIQKSLSWEAFDFCNESCLTRHQKVIGSFCANCKIEVKDNFLGKYCVRFGFSVRQFCSSTCLEQYKKSARVCSFCQNDISSHPSSFLTSIWEKGMSKDFCTSLCMKKYNEISRFLKGPKLIDKCCVCHKTNTIEIEFKFRSKTNLFCSDPCFVAFKYVNDVAPEKCDMCCRYFVSPPLSDNSLIRYDGVLRRFCQRSCQNIYITTNRKIVSCCWCKVKKYNFDMIQKYTTENIALIICSLTCLNFFNASVNASKLKRKRCDFCHKICKGQYHITLADDSMKNFCSYPCVQGYQNKYIMAPARFTEPVPPPPPPVIVPTATATTSRVTRKTSSLQQRKQIIPDVPGPLPIITSVRSLAPVTPSMTTRSTRSKSSGPSIATITTLQEVPGPPPVRRIILVKPPDLPTQRNMATLVKPITCDVEVEIKPIMVDKYVQTEDIKDSLVLLPVPVPIYIPQPVEMFNLVRPVPLPFPLPIPIPMFIPVTKQTAGVVLKEMKKNQIRAPADPYEADLLVMAELVAGENEKKEQPESEAEAESDGDNGAEPSFSPEPQDASNTFGDDMLQMALKMASDFDEPAVDLEGALTASTITATPGNASNDQADDITPIAPPIERSSFRGRRRGRPPRYGRRGRKRGRPPTHPQNVAPVESEPEPPPEPIEKPDANMCLKYTFGVNAWKQWVTTKNAELEKTTRPAKLFKSDLLQLTSDELNYSLCLFVKEVRKPNGAEYAPDTIYYLCLGIQQYLFENGRIDNIFCDSYYESFTDCLDEVCRKFSTLYNDSQYIVTRVEEEHLWESKQLGAHSPHVLLSTLMFFNTKHFNLTNVDEHMQLSFSHIMKHWKRVATQPGTPKNSSSRNILLRFYPPQSIAGNKSKKKVYEQQENEENPLRCPVKLYDFYISKCPESVKTRNDLFYLLPERSCVPDSPVWYSTMTLGKEALEKMLHRVKMVKEINVALLAS